MTHFLLHPSDEQIAAYLDGGLSDACERDQVEVHLVNCQDCRQLAGGVILTRLEMELHGEWGV